MTKAWQERQSVTDSQIEPLGGYGEEMARLLYARGIRTPDEAKQFLDPQYEESHDPFLLLDMKKAIERIGEALAKNQKITVYADYDADAVTATAVVLRFFQEIGYSNTDYYIPDRFSEGYGVSSEAIKNLAEQGTELIITVDTGTNAIDAVKQANDLGVDVIVTDHHQVNQDLPNAYAVVNPHREGDPYPFKSLTGVGVAFKLVQALISVTLEGRSPDRVSEDSIQPSPKATADTVAAFQNDKIKDGWEKWLLDLVAIGTVADCQSLLDENRMLVKWGMLVLQKSKWLGLRRLMEVAEIDSKKISAYTIGFQIAPRINAAGRIEHASLALELMITNDEEKASELAYQLNELNAKRQNLTDQILSEAREQVQSQHGHKIRFAYDQNWPKGILGLVAGRLSSEFHRPTLVMSVEKGEVTGSARSIEGFSIFKALKSAGEHFEKYGGHEQAAGFSLREKNIEPLKKALLFYAEENLDDELLSPVLFYDSELELVEVNESFVDLLEQLEPFGASNPRPQFRLNNLSVRHPSKIGAEGKHLRLYVGDGKKSFSCIGFGLGYWADKLLVSEKAIDILAEPQYNEWNGQRKIQLKINDIKFSE